MTIEPSLLEIYMLFLLHLGDSGILSSLYYDNLYDDVFGWGPKDIWIIIPDKNLKIKIDLSNETMDRTMYYDNVPIVHKDVNIRKFHYIVEPFANRDEGLSILCVRDKYRIFNEMVDCLNYIYSQ